MGICCRLSERLALGGFRTAKKQVRPPKPGCGKRGKEKEIHGERSGGRANLPCEGGIEGMQRLSG